MRSACVRPGGEHRPVQIDGPRPSPGRTGQVIPQTVHLLPLLFALNFAIGLPPGSVARLPDAGWPTVRASDRPLINAASLAAILARPVAPAALGTILLGEVDRRLAGLAVTIDVARLVGAAGGLVALSTVSATGPGGGASVADLWRLAREAVIERRVSWRPLDGLGADAFLASYDQTVQVCWLAGDRLATASVTDLEADRRDLALTTQWIAQFADWSHARARA
jgi:hypothetical protein